MSRKEYGEVGVLGNQGIVSLEDFGSNGRISSVEAAVDSGTWVILPGDQFAELGVDQPVIQVLGAFEGDDNAAVVQVGASIAVGGGVRVPEDLLELKGGISVARGAVPCFDLFHSRKRGARSGAWRKHVRMGQCAKKKLNKHEFENPH